MQMSWNKKISDGFLKTHERNNARARGKLGNIQNKLYNGHPLPLKHTPQAMHYFLNLGQVETLGRGGCEWKIWGKQSFPQNSLFFSEKKGKQLECGMYTFTSLVSFIWLVNSTISKYIQNHFYKDKSYVHDMVFKVY